MATGLIERAESPAAAVVAREPNSVEQTGLDLAHIADLALKFIYFNNQITAQTISDEVCLPFYNIVDKALMVLKREDLIEVAGSNGFGELAYQYSITPKGVVRVHQILERTTYVGPAPVTLDQYKAVIKQQAISEVCVGPNEVREAMADLVLEEHVLDAMGQAVNTGRSLFLFGPPGNGKTMLAEHIVPLLGGNVLIPYAFTVDGQIIKVLDLHNHEPIQLSGRPDFDRRFVMCKRPAVVTGGELMLEGLDLVYDKFARIYEAPLQVKSNGGMLLIDDFGRQQVSPRQLLNRWIVPLEKRVDFLTLHTGKKVEVPFDQLIVFSTNMAPKDLVDEAFLRRIQNKINVTNPSVEAFREIFRRQCEALKVPFEQNGLVYLLREYYVKPKRELRSVHPRDILRTLVGIARYHNIPPTLTPSLLDRACQTYFVDL
jgi:predicted ATPase with chaperone activity